MIKFKHTTYSKTAGQAMALLCMNSPTPGWAAQVEGLTVARLGQRASDDTQGSGEHCGCRPFREGPSETKGHKPPWSVAKLGSKWGSRAFLSHQHRTPGGPRACSQIWHLEISFLNPRKQLCIERPASYSSGRGTAPLSAALWAQTSPGHRTQRTREEGELPLGSPRAKARLRSLEASAVNGGIMRTPPTPTLCKSSSRQDETNASAYPTMFVFTLMTHWMPLLQYQILSIPSLSH